MIRLCPWCGGTLAGKPGQYIKCKHCASDISWAEGRPFRSADEAESYSKDFHEQTTARNANLREQHLHNTISQPHQTVAPEESTPRKSIDANEMAFSSPKALTPSKEESSPRCGGGKPSSLRFPLRLLKSAIDVASALVEVGIFGKRKLTNSSFSKTRIGLQIFLRGEVFHDEGLTEINRSQAQFLTTKAKRIRLDAVVKLTDGAADEFAAFEGELFLPKLKTLRHAGLARKLGKGNCKTIPQPSDLPEEISGLLYWQLLNSPAASNELRWLSPGLAQILSDNLDDLELNGLNTLSTTTADILTQHQGKRICLDGLTTLTLGVAQSLAFFEGSLRLNGITELDQDALEALANHTGSLYLGGLRSLTTDAAEVLARHQGNLCLSGIQTISPDTARAFTEHLGALDLSGLSELTPSAAAAICLRKGSTNLSGLRAFDESTAKKFTHAIGPVILPDANSLSSDVRVK